MPPWCRKSPKVSEVLPLLYLHGLSTGDFAPALAEFFGSAAGLSPSVITRMTTQWQTEHRAFMNRSLAAFTRERVQPIPTASHSDKRCTSGIEYSLHGISIDRWTT